MLASNGMRLARELRSPLAPGPRSSRPPRSSSPATRDRPSLPWLGLAAARARRRPVRDAEPARRRRRLRAARRARRLVRALDRLVDRGRPQLGATRTAPSSTSPSPSSARTSAPDIGRLLFGFSGLLGAVCVWALAGKVLPWLYEDYGRIARLRAPIGYWNALALLGDIALPIGLCLATRRRTAGTLLVYGWLVVIGLTYSRGGVLVAVVVVALWMILSKAWLEALSTLLAAGLPALGALAVAFSLSGRHERRAVAHDACPRRARLRRRAARERRDRRGARALRAAGDAARPAARSRRARDRRRRRRSRSAPRMLTAGGTSFTTPSATELPNSPNRLVELGSNFRWAWWTQAWDGWEANPIVGTGAGSFDVTNLRYRQSSLDETIEPHNLPVQFLSETGLDRRRLSSSARSAGSSSAAGAGPGRSSRSRSRCPRTSCTGCSTSTGTSSRSRRPCS